jgi:hypothetical protein
MKRIIILFTLAFILLLAASAFAQEEEEEEKWRNFEVNVNSGLTQPGSFLSDWRDSLGAKVGFQLALSGGYYFTNNFCTGLYFTYIQMGIEGDWGRSIKMYNLGGYAKYAFTGESNFEPYAKVSAGVIAPKYPTWITSARNQLREQSYDPGFSSAVYAGLLFYTSDNGGLFFEAGYHYDFIKDASSDYSGDTIEDNVNYFEYRLGISVFYGSEE